MAPKASSRIVVPAVPAPPAEPAEPEHDEVVEEIRDELGDTFELDQYREWRWFVYRLRTVEERRSNPRGSELELMSVMSGPLDVMAIQQNFGGGDYDVRGFGDGRMRLRKRFALGGPRKVFTTVVVDAPAPVNSVVPAAPTPAPADDRLARALEAIDRRLEGLAAVQNGGQLSVKDVLTLLPLLNGGANRPPDFNGQVFQSVVEAWTKGMEMGAGREPAEKSVPELVIEKLGPSLERLLAVMLTRRRAAAAPAPGAPQPAPSSATVVGDPEPEPAAPSTPATVAAQAAALDLSAMRWTSAVDALARAIATDRDPEAFADSLEDMLDSGELALLRMATAQQVLERVGDDGLRRYPLLATEPGRAYIDQVLTVLRTPPEDEPAEQ